MRLIVDVGMMIRIAFCELLSSFYFQFPYFCPKNILMYPAELVMPMKAELTGNGFEDLSTPEQVDIALHKAGTTLLVLNSVCGCSAGTARPGVLDAVKQARTYLMPYPPSSPCIAILKDGQLVHMIERHMIEGRPAQMIAANLIEAFEQYC
jgi:hypothetical protein